MVKTEKKYILLSIVSLGIIILDQLSKWLIYSFDVEKDFLLFNISKVENTGAAFGMMKNSTFMLIILGLIVITLLLYYLHKEAKTKMEIIASSLIIGGALGNIIDRASLGFVRDFFQLFTWFPTFNLADSAITIGAVLLVFSQFRKK